MMNTLYIFIYKIKKDIQENKEEDKDDKNKKGSNKKITIHIIRKTIYIYTT